MKILFLGDIYSSSDTSNITICKELMTEIEECDYIIANLEGPLSKESYKSWKKAGPNLKQNKTIINLLRSLKVTHVNLSNNHSFDFGIDGLKYTQQTLDEHGINHFGAGTISQAYEPLILNKGTASTAIVTGTEAQFGALVDYYPYDFGYSWIFSKNLQKNIQQLKQDGLTVILFSHHGLEGISHPLPEWRHLNMSFIDMGVDLIINTHTHCIQAKEIYKSKAMYHSLGNFYFINGKNPNPPEWYKGLVTKVSVCKEGLKSEEIFINFSNNSISIDKANHLHFESLKNELLNQDSYIKYIDNELDKAWNDYYCRYYSNPVSTENKNIRGFDFHRYLVNLAKKRFFIEINHVLMQHNLQIETHRFAVERYLRKLNNTY